MLFSTFHVFCKGCVQNTFSIYSPYTLKVCSNAARVYVHESIFDKFIEKVVDATKNLCVEDTFNSRAVIGALISKEHLEKVEGFIQRAVGEVR